MKCKCMRPGAVDGVTLGWNWNSPAQLEALKFFEVFCWTNSIAVNVIRISGSLGKIGMFFT